ncbi:hypothetical protein SAMN05192565_11722 [Methylobacterium gossipiicola]|uniref:DUF2946 domain-containing protein n=1 Tax=Methylobacterium gossipiicola TaxID=582675 RepID=A0A1I2VWC5_9HYPH|nr:hypothetical protein SAMN05192565_11722 [Methylobacterium gossipiicola]
MHGHRPLGARHRAIIAVIALYALCLQAILGTALPLPVPGQDTGLCLHEAGDTGSETPAPIHVHLACCTAAQALPGLDLPPAVVTDLAVPEPRAVRVAWRPHAAAQPRAPPRTQAHARAPPVA